MAAASVLYSGVMDELIPRIWRRRLLALALVFFVALALYSLGGILLPFLLAWIAAYLLTPLVDFLEERLHLKRTSAVVTAITLFAIAGLVGLLVTVPIVAMETSHLVRAFPGYVEKVEAHIDSFRQAGRIPYQAEVVAEAAMNKLKESAPEIAAYAGSLLLDWMGSLVSIVGFIFSFLLFVFVFFFFLRDFHVIGGNMANAVPVRHRETMTNLLTEIDVNLRAVLRGQLLVAIGMGVLYAVGLGIAGVPYAILIGLVAGLGNFLPYIGPMLGLVPAFGFVLLHADFSSGFSAEAVAGPVIGILIVFAVVQFLEGFVLTPKFAGEAVGLGPVATLFAISAGGAILGLVGVVAALPAAAVAKVLLSRGWRAYSDSAFYRRA